MDLLYADFGKELTNRIYYMDLSIWPCDDFSFWKLHVNGFISVKLDYKFLNPVCSELTGRED